MTVNHRHRSSSKRQRSKLPVLRGSVLSIGACPRTTPFLATEFNSALKPTCLRRAAYLGR